MFLCFFLKFQAYPCKGVQNLRVPEVIYVYIYIHVGRPRVYSDLIGICRGYGLQQLGVAF